GESLDRQLRLGILTDVGGRRGYGATHFGSQLTGDRNLDARAGEAVEFARIFKQRDVTALTHVSQNRSHHALGFLEAHRFSRDQSASVAVIQSPDHHITILFNGYSTMPCAPASFKRGRIVRTVDSSRMVFTASHCSSLKCEMVGFLR